MAAHAPVTPMRGKGPEASALKPALGEWGGVILRRGASL